MANQTSPPLTVPQRSALADRVAGAVDRNGVTVDDLCTIADAVGVPVEHLLIGDPQ